MPVDKLSDLARRACVKNIKRLFDIGECPYDLIRPALLKIESPEQLVSRPKLSQLETDRIYAASARDKLSPTHRKGRRDMAEVH